MTGPPSPHSGRVVLKFGGSSVATVDRLRAVAEQVVERRRSGWDVVVVVSAMGDTTDQLLAQAQSVAGEPDRRELDMLLSVGERISMSLLAMAIRNAGFEAVSLTGSQSGIITTASHAQARIIEVRPFRVEDELERGRVVIVAGYQGVSYTREVTTLGRGGSDTTAVALAAALNADAWEICSDVDGVYTADPRVVPSAARLAELSFEEMQALAQAGARVLNAEAVQFARDRGIAVYARKTGSANPGTAIRAQVAPAPNGVRGLALAPQVWVVQSDTVSFERADTLLGELHALDINPYDWRHSVRPGPRAGPLGFWLPLDDLHAPAAAAEAIARSLGTDALRQDLGMVSLIGPRLEHRADLLRRALDAIPECAGAFSRASGWSFFVAQDAVSDVSRALHAAMGLDAPAAHAT